MAIIQIQDVSKKFQTKDGEIDALKHVTLDIEAGDIYGIIGMSGAGKSTLVRCINHIEVPTEGMVIVQDKDLSKPSSSLKNLIGLKCCSPSISINLIG